MATEFLQSSIEYLKGVGPKKAEVLKSELGIFTFEDLLNYFPFRYVDRSRFVNISEIDSESAYVQIKGVITGLKTIGTGAIKRLSGMLRDETGEIELVWFKGIKWVVDKIKPNISYIVFARPTLYKGKYNLVHPEIEPDAEAENGWNTSLQPVYSSTEKLKTKGLDSRGISRLTKYLVSMSCFTLPETMPDEIIGQLKLVSRELSVRNIHHPENQPFLDRAIARLKFEELFYIQLAMLRQKYQRNKKSVGLQFTTVGTVFNTFYHNYLPFQLTDAQKRVIREIRTDMGSGKQMNRLLQGDVGSGKTLVALMSMLIAADNGFQSCLMAPTEILAQQHFSTISTFLGEMDIQIGLLTGSTKVSDRRQIHGDLESGTLKILIGTHALIEEKVIFNNLGLVVIDEQHRFGVEQRARLWKKSQVPPHILVMTATPIPRTLAMTMYGDLDYSVINELPPGRKPVQTYHYYDSKRLPVFNFLKKQIAGGRQVYIVYPLISESETLDLKDLMDGYESISREFPLPDYAIGIIHGHMKTEEKDFEMQRFRKGETQILVATTVIEVGMDVPNATVMVIENAERFGLSQLHQLRGRVGRGAGQSYCILMTSFKLSSDAKTRIETMIKTSDGFEIAEVDMRLRGPGDIHGTQQSGMLNLQLADIVRDEKILKVAREIAITILDSDPLLEHPKNHILVKQLEKLYKKHYDWSRIS